MSLWQLESLADAAEMESCDSTHMTGVTDQRGVHNIMTNMQHSSNSPADMFSFCVGDSDLTNYISYFEAPVCGVKLTFYTR